MVSIVRSFRILIVDDNETDVKVVKRIIAKDYKSIDVTSQSDSTDWKVFFKGNKVDFILLNYTAGSSLGVQEIKKIIAADDTIPIYVMIWQHEIEVGMKAVYQGAEGFIIKDKTYLNLKKVIQRYLSNYSVSMELVASKEINEIFSEAINDGFFRFTQDGETDYISDKFINSLGFDTDFEVSANVADLFAKIDERVQKTTEFDKGVSFIFETDGKDGKHFWFQVYVYKKFDAKNGILYFEGVLKDIGEVRIIEQTLSDFKKEIELLFNSFPLPIEIYNKEGKKISSNKAFSKMLLSTSAIGEEPLSKSDVANLLKDSIAKTFKMKSFSLDNQKVVLGETEKYFNISYFTSIENPENVYAIYNDITENANDKNKILKDRYHKKALFNSVDMGFIEVNLIEEITDISEKTIRILGKERANYLMTPIYKFLDILSFETLSFAFQESKRIGRYSFTANDFLRIAVQVIVNSQNEHIGYIIAIENNEQSIKLEETSNANDHKISLFSDIKNIFLWVGIISETGIKPDYCSKGVTDITGYSIKETMDDDYKLVNYFFDTEKNNTLEKIVAYISDNIHQEKNLIDKRRNIKRVKIKFYIRKEHKTKYRVGVIVENITELINQRDEYISLLLSINNIISTEESVLFKIDESFMVQEIYHRHKLFEKEVVLHDKFHGFGKIDPNTIIEILEKSLSKNVVSETVLFSKSSNRRFKILVIPLVNYAGHKFLYIFIKDITIIGNVKNDYNYYSKLFDSVKDLNNTLVFILENDTIVFANEAMKNLMNYKEESIHGVNITELFVGNDYSNGFSNKLPKTSRKKRVELMLNLKDKTGNQKICKFDVSVISGTEYPERVFLIGNNETEKEDLRNDIAYRARLQSILFASETDAIIVWYENEVVYHNKKFISLFGYSDKEIRKLNKFDLFSSIQTNDVVDVLPNLFLDTSPDTTNDHSTLDIICKTKQGEEFYAKISVSKHLFLSKNVFVLIVNDISEKKQLENIIYMLNNKTDSLITSLVEGIWIFNNEYKTIYLSPIALKYLGYSFEDVQEKRIFYFIKDGISDFDKNYFEGSPEAQYLNLNVSFIKKEDGIFQTSINIVPLRNEKSQFMGGILSMRDLSDISDRDTKIEKLNEYNSELDQQIISLTKDLEDARKLIDRYKSESEKLINELGEKIESINSMNDELNVANKQLMRLYIIIQSNLKSHISNISGFSDFMNKVWNKITSEQQLEYFNILLTSSKQASYTFDKILLLSNIALNKLNIQKEVINISTKLVKVLEPKLDKFNAKQISLDYKFNQNHYVNADMKLIDLVLNEIISNSLKYTRQDGEVKIEVVEIENMTTVSIQDNGVGITQDKLNNIFDYDDSTKLNNFGNRTGSGLSLFIVKELLQLQGGNIEISSEENKGTEVIVTLPSDKKAICFVGSESNSEIIKNLLDSHYPDFSFLFSSVVGDLIDEISSGIEPSVIFLTAFLPENEFFLYVEKLRSVYDKPIIIVSSEFSDEFRNQLLANNIFSFIPLPLHRDDVKDILAKLIH